MDILLVFVIFFFLCGVIGVGYFIFEWLKFITLTMLDEHIYKPVYKYLNNK